MRPKVIALGILVIAAVGSAIANSPENFHTLFPVESEVAIRATGASWYDVCRFAEGDTVTTSVTLKRREPAIKGGRIVGQIVSVKSPGDDATTFTWQGTVYQLNTSAGRIEAFEDGAVLYSVNPNNASEVEAARETVLKYGWVLELVGVVVSEVDEKISSMPRDWVPALRCQ